MTEREIRDHLELLGYSIAPCAYRDAVHFMRPRRGAGTWDAAAIAAEKYSIDLATACWNRWGGDGLWHHLSELPPQCDANRQATPSATSTLTTEPDRTQGLGDAAPRTFVAACLDAGFTLDDNLTRSIDFGNRFARWTDGRRYLIHESAGQITDCATGETRCLEEFGRPLAAVRPQPPEPAPRPHTFTSMRDRPLQMQGARVQKSLF